MADNAPKPPAAAETKKPKPAPAFEIYTSNPAYTGIHPCRLRFDRGVGRTGDLKAAQHCRDVGLSVFDLNDEDDAKALKAFLKGREKGKDAAE